MIKTTLNSLLLFCIVVLTSFSCSSSKQVKIDENKPEWAKKTPTSFSHYVGVGIVNKENPDFRASAMKLALENISNEISVNISSESVLYSLENNTSFQQEFEQQIRLNSDKYLEGYEQIDSYEDKNYYYVYYQLSKQKYAELKAKMLKSAIDKSMLFFNQAATLKKQHDYRSSIVNYIKSLEVLSEFLDQVIEKEIEGETKVLPLEIVRRIKEIENEIVITPSFEKETFVYGAFVSNDAVFVKVTDLNGAVLSSFPMVFEHKAQFVKKINTTTNPKGIAEFALGKLKSDIQQQTVRVYPDIEEVINIATKNRIVRELISIRNSNEVVMKLNVRLPKVYFQIQGSESVEISTALSNALILNKFQVTTNKSDADLVLELNINENSNSTVKNAFGLLVEISGNINVVNASGSLVYTQNIPTQKGMQSTIEMARSIAIDDFCNLIKSRTIPLFANNYYQD